MLNGNSGANVLDGGAGTDTMAGDLGLAYCERDTEAMLRLFQTLKETSPLRTLRQKFNRR